MRSAEIARALAASPILSGFPPEIVTARTFAAGDALSDCPDGVPSLGLVARGLVDVWSVAPDGNAVLLNTLHPGDCFGVSNLMSGGGLKTSLRAASRCTILFLPKAAFEEACREDGALALRYARLCGRKLQFLLQRIALLTAQTSRGRLLSWLLLHAGEDGTVPLEMTREELAASLSVSRAALYREFSYLTGKDLLRMSRRSLTITDRAALERLLGETAGPETAPSEPVNQGG